jgi:hypothetical protein
MALSLLYLDPMKTTETSVVRQVTESSNAPAMRSGMRVKTNVQAGSFGGSPGTQMCPGGCEGRGPGPAGGGGTGP